MNNPAAEFMAYLLNISSEALDQAEANIKKSKELLGGQGNE